VNVLNINELANALKPVVLPGEAMRVFILKEGKEYNQGVAYLDDGTMVVVDNARRLIGKNADIAVTSVLQTTAGKMIFGRLDERAEMPTTRITQPHAVNDLPRHSENVQRHHAESISGSERLPRSVVPDSSREQE
ncbi:MAG TPA: TRAM domain-containing protein, partial [Candidatus Acidoferrales bacterium]|nr:TRAM domain-containing protein [Candidatus Acidoferrales bacterium]